MSFFYDKLSRKFFTGIILFVLFLFIIDMIIATMQKNIIQKVIINHDNAMVSCLLEQGVPENIIAKAVTNTQITQNGEKLLGKLGINENTDVRFLPFISNFSRKTIFVNSIKFIFSTIFILIIVILFLYKRERLYMQAAKTVSDYSEGNFYNYLPQSYTGTIYYLFGCINNMASVLKSKHENEHNTKKFLKNTISDISHQLKTPLAALSMYNEIILDEPENTNTVILFTQKSDIAIERIKTLVLTLLKITRLDAGCIDFEKRKYPIIDVINKAIENLTIRAENEKKKIIIKGNQNETIFCDINWTSEAIGNIVKNALDHTNINGEINISWERTPIELRIFIADNGSGIQEEDFHHIFKRFYRSKNSSNIQGIGLGLPLAKAVIEGQGGIISLQTKQGEGTIFSIMFPYKTVR